VYSIVASAKPDLVGYLALNIDPSNSDLLDQFSIFLEQKHYVAPPPTYAQIVAAAEQSPIVSRLSKFRGVVFDRGGAPIPGVFIDIVVKGTQGEKHAARVRSDELGRFSAQLADGEYVALFGASGFERRVLPLTISKAAGNGELQVVLEVVVASE
jgi:hypothetical protein